MSKEEFKIYWHNNSYTNLEDMGLIIWYYEGSDTSGKKYRLGYREGNNSSIAIYEEIK